jgi:hypothetical protein
MSSEERNAFVAALLELKASGGYDPTVAMHQSAMQPGHNGPAFLPWHREYLRRFENDLKAIDPDVTLPYWDWTSANVDPDGTSVLWNDAFLGGPGDASGNVTDGQFAAWGITRNGFDPAIAPPLSSPEPYLSLVTYDGFRSIELGPHNAGHNWVGGSMAVMATSPADPVFWMFHANIDRVWAEWVDRHRDDPGFDPYPHTGDAAQGHNLNDSMWPWNGQPNNMGVQIQRFVESPETRRPADVLDHRSLGYLYDSIDTACDAPPPPPPPQPPPPPAPGPEPTPPASRPPVQPPAPTVPSVPTVPASAVKPRPRKVLFRLSRRPKRSLARRLIVRGQVVPAVGQRCGGRVLLRAYVGKRRIVAKKVGVRRVRKRCRFVAVLPVRRTGKARVVAVTARFTGTSRMRPLGSRSKRIRIR